MREQLGRFEWQVQYLKNVLGVGDLQSVLHLCGDAFVKVLVWKLGGSDTVAAQALVALRLAAHFSSTLRQASSSTAVTTTAAAAAAAVVSDEMDMFLLQHDYQQKQQQQQQQREEDVMMVVFDQVIA